MPVPTSLSFLGIAKEATKGTAVNPTAFLPVKTINPHDKIKFVPVELLKGSMSTPYGEIPTMHWTEFETAGPVFPDTFGWQLAGILGDITTTGTAAPFTQAISVKNSGDGQPTSHTLTDFYAVTQARQYAGIQWHEVGLKFTADGLLEHSSKATGLVASAQVAKPTASFTTLTPVPTWQAVLTIGGTNITKSMEGDLTLTRKLEMIPGLNNTQQYASIFLGEFSAKGKLKFYIDDDTELTRYLTNTQPSLDLTWTSGAGATLTTVQLHFSQAAYIDVKPDRSKQFVAYDMDFEAVANTTDVGASGGYSPVKATLLNAIASGTYI